ncbi:hypothetical protein [Pseudonocardia alaniniphila]|uniref:Uncharacterized protein n=1 Tax=Pseudonocardia alaniniphila TaxID=75291 RepID=A0ABS9T8Z0_9PSEU|nr:hypothetical protein [Pseudonocardia alaniniphila]MCH6164888.1 hypothetical protein [Pseudonocardia alaniniphila]
MLVGTVAAGTSTVVVFTFSTDMIGTLLVSASRVAREPTDEFRGPGGS